MRKSKGDPLPENYVSFRMEGYGLWEVWSYENDQKDRVATPVTYYFNKEPLRFLTSDDAERHAIKLARKNHWRTYKVVIKR